MFICETSKLLLRLGGACVLAAGLLTACGGGGGSSLQQPASITQGPVSGFGSIIVNGVRFDDSSASVSDDDDDSDGGRSRDDIRLGAMVTVESGSIDRSSNSARALRIRFGSEIVGPVSSVDTAARTLVVLGQTVEVTDTTVFDDSLAGGLAGITVGEVLEVHAIFNAATQRYVATRIEDKNGATEFKLRGLVSALDTTAKTFQIGGEVINYAAIAPADLPGNLADGLRVRVRVQTIKNAQDQWVATRVRLGERRVDDHDEAEVRGIVSDYDAATKRFNVNGLPVDASGATIESGLANGVQVEVEGRIQDGVLIARKVELEDNHRDDDDRRLELHGTLAADPVNQTFVLRGVTVSFSGNVEFRNGTQAALRTGARVEVKGRLSADGTTLQATRISFES